MRWMPDIHVEFRYSEGLVRVCDEAVGRGGPARPGTYAPRTLARAIRSGMDASRTTFPFSLVSGISAGLPSPGPCGTALRAPLAGPGGDTFPPQWHLWVDSLPPNGTFGWTLCHPKVPSGGNRARAM